MRRLFKNVRVFGGQSLQQMDVLVDEGGVVAGLGEGLEAAGAEALNAEGMVLSPGFTDLHVHLRQPGFEEKETIATGTAAAAAGGFTTVCAMPNLAPVPDNAEALAMQWRAIKENGTVRVLPYGALTVGQRGEALSDIAGLAPHVAGFSDDGYGVQSEALMRVGMAAVAGTGRFVATHSEDTTLLPKNAVCVQGGSGFAQRLGVEGFPPACEWKQAERDIRLAEETGCRLHICHASCRETVELVRAAKHRGVPVSCEVTPHNLLLGWADIPEDDGRFKMNPPLRGAEDVQAAQAALLDGTVDAIATDHAPHTPAQKAGGFAAGANGVVGLETAFAALYTHLVLPGLLPLERLLALLTTGPAAVLHEPLGVLRQGGVADFVLLDLSEERVVDPEAFATKGRATPFAGWALRGWPRLTMAAGREVYNRL